MEAKQSSMGRRLERINAIRNAEYHAAAPPPGFEINLGRSSFRIRGGSDREIELLYSSLGLSGPDDFAIQPSVWAAAVKSHLDLSSSANAGHSATLLDQPVGNQSEVDLDPLSTAPLPPPSSSVSAAVDVLCKDEERRGADDSEVSSASRSVREEMVCIEEVKVASVLPPPPGGVKKPAPCSIRLPPVDSWAILDSFAPEQDDIYRSESEEIEEEEGQNELDGVRDGVTVNSHTESSSKIEDDIVGMKVDLIEEKGEVISISPHGSLKRTITSWSKGGMLGSGSFGAVYEAISQ